MQNVKEESKSLNSFIGLQSTESADRVNQGQGSTNVTDASIDVMDNVEGKSTEKSMVIFPSYFSIPTLKSTHSLQGHWRKKMVISLRSGRQSREKDSSSQKGKS